MSSALRRILRFSRIHPLSLQLQQSPFNSSLASSSSPPPLLLAKPSRNSSALALFLPLRFASSVPKQNVGADENLKRVLEAEIQCADESEDHNQGGVLPSNFPFEIIDNPGEQTIILKRELSGESIRVEVHMPDMTGDDLDEDDNGDEDDADEKGEDSLKPSISLIVTVTKGEGPHLEFCCTANSDEITIDAMSLKAAEVPSDQIAYEGPEFQDLDDDLQKSMCKYLEARGIEKSLATFLHDYMINKDGREYLGWLKNMKEFVEK